MRPHLEELEPRCAMAVLVLDPTPPDADAFNSLVLGRRAQRTRWLDVNHDRRIDQADAEILQGRVLEATQKLFVGQPLTVVLDEGDAWVERQRETGEPIFVVWVGGWPGRDHAFRGTLGEAVQASEGENWCGPAWVYPNELLREAIKPGWRKRAWTADRFVRAIASTIGHEFGHLLGLAHGTGIMSEVFNDSTKFSDQDWAEIGASLAGEQPTQPMPMPV